MVPAELRYNYKLDAIAKAKTGKVINIVLTYVLKSFYFYVYLYKKKKAPSVAKHGPAF